VESGDSLWAIAEQELGDGNRWRELYDANKNTIGDNPDLIEPGMVLKIPT
jgi:nucleoid-associated protein YgaU